MTSEILRNLIGCLGGLGTRKTADKSWKIKTLDWCIIDTSYESRTKYLKKKCISSCLHEVLFDNYVFPTLFDIPNSYFFVEV